jgi:tRNA-modifying protein YgfZ
MPNDFFIGSLTIVQVAGGDRNKIVNNLCTQDIRTLADGQIAETFITDVKGRTLSHGIVAGLPDKLWFLTTPGQQDRLVPHIDRYIIREDATVSGLSDAWSGTLVPPSSPTLATFRDWPNWDANRSAQWLHRDGAEAVCVDVPWWTGGAKLVLVPSSDLQSPGEVANSSVANSSVAASETSNRQGWELERLRAFWPWYGIDCDERNLPQELGIDDRAISFHKGCYLGQETVARLDALGQVQKKLVLLRIDGDGPLSLPCRVELEGKEIATITSVASTGQGDRLALGMVRRGHLAVGDRFAVGGTWATVIPRP